MTLCFTSRQALFASALALLSCSQTALACSATPYIGATCFTAVKYCPQGYIEASGQTLNVQQYIALFALLGRQYTPSTVSQMQFNVPDLRGRSPVSWGQSTNEFLAPGQQRGTENTTLTVAQLPAHTHQASPNGNTFTLNATDSQGTSASPGAGTNQLAAATALPAKVYAPAGGTQVPLSGVSSTSGATVTVGATGAGQPFVSRSPQIVLRACIAYQGIYPPRS